MPFLYQDPQNSLSASGTLESAPVKYRLSHTEETVNQKICLHYTITDPNLHSYNTERQSEAEH
jgi:hypothetical protein